MEEIVKENQPSEETDIQTNTTSTQESEINVIGAEELPEDMELLEFDSMEEFEEFVQNSENYEDEMLQAEDNEKEVSLDSSNDDVSTQTTYSGTSLACSICVPTYTFPVGYTYVSYSYSGTPSSFSNFNSINFYDNGAVTQWVSTITPYANINSTGSSATLHDSGYYLLGASIEGFEVGLTTNASHQVIVTP